MRMPAPFDTGIRQMTYTALAVVAARELKVRACTSVRVAMYAK